MIHLKSAIRSLGKRPVVSLVAILSLALGIGANGALFSVVEGVLLRPLPVPSPERLVNIEASPVRLGATGVSCSNAGSCETVFSHPMFRDLEEAESPQLAGVAAHRGFGANLAVDAGTSAGDGLSVSGGYFSTLGLEPALGRLIGAADDSRSEASPVAVLSHDFWVGRMGADPSAVGRTIRVNGQPLEIVGVAPEGFRGTTLGSRPDVFVPLSLQAALEPDRGRFENRRSYWLYLFGRLAEDATRQEAEAALSGLYRSIRADIEAPALTNVEPDELERFVEGGVTLLDGRRGQSTVDEAAGLPLILLFAVTGMVLLIACANVANLLLTRSITRRGEMAIRGSLGARRRDIVSQLMTEALVLAGLGAAAGIVVGVWGMQLLTGYLPSDLGLLFDPRMDLRVLGFTVVVALLTGAGFGLYPAVFGSRTDLATLIRASSGQASGGRSAARFRTAVVTGQLALCLVLLVGAGLFATSLRNVARVELGIRTESIVTFRVSPQRSGYQPEESAALFAEIEEGLAALPGASSVSSAVIPVLSGSEIVNSLAVEGFDPPPSEERSGTRLNAVGPDYFRTLGMPLLFGREFEIADDEDAPQVAVVNEAFARAFDLGGPAAIGRRLGSNPDELDVEIVGLVADAVYSGPKDTMEPMYFRPYRQWGPEQDQTFYVRTAGEPESMIQQIRATMRTIEPDLPLQAFRTMEQQVGEMIAADRAVALLVTLFAALAATLAAIGLYGVLAFAVAQRTREFGLRMALGAGERRIRGIVLRSLWPMLVAGGVIGTAMALALGRLTRSMLFEVGGADPAVILAAVAGLSILAIGSAYLPARQASRVEPMTALRHE